MLGRVVLQQQLLRQRPGVQASLVLQVELAPEQIPLQVREDHLEQTGPDRPSS